MIWGNLFPLFGFSNREGTCLFSTKKNSDKLFLHFKDSRSVKNHQVFKKFVCEAELLFKELE